MVALGHLRRLCLASAAPHGAGTSEPLALIGRRGLGGPGLPRLTAQAGEEKVE